MGMSRVTYQGLSSCADFSPPGVPFQLFDVQHAYPGARGLALEGATFGLCDMRRVRPA